MNAVARKCLIQVLYLICVCLGYFTVFQQKQIYAILIRRTCWLSETDRAIPCKSNREEKDTHNKPLPVFRKLDSENNERFTAYLCSSIPKIILPRLLVHFSLITFHLTTCNPANFSANSASKPKTRRLVGPRGHTRQRPLAAKPQPRQRRLHWFCLHHNPRAIR